MFWITGHTYMFVDSNHAIIEQYMPDKAFWTPSEYY